MTTGTFPHTCLPRDESRLIWSPGRRLPADAKLLDVIYAVRSDESTHRFVNHSLANLEAARDVNPFALREPDMFTKGRKIAYAFS